VAAEPLGESVQGRAITAKLEGGRDARVRVLVVGQIHGDEPAGRKVVRALRRLEPPRDVAVWTVRSVNPDGAARGTRQNARGVDLNRNFGRGWRPSTPGTRYYGGPRPFSEPESKAVRRLVRRIRPRLTIWFHQPYGFVVRPFDAASRRLARRYAGLVDMPLRALPRYPGTATGWQNHRFPGTDAFVVELKAGTVTARRARRHARAVLALAAGLRPL
jgi:protein MpaA